MENRAEMRIKSKILYLIFVSLLIGCFYPIYESVGQESVYTSPTYSFEMDENTNFTVVSQAPLTWQQYQYENITVTIRVSGLPVGENLSLTLVSFLYNYPDDPVPHSYGSEIINQNLTNIDETYKFNKTLLPPDQDRFNITIKIIANSTGVPYAQEFFAEFPGDEPYIEVKKSRALPVINLPGFPDPQTFVRWIFIFLVIVGIISLPSIFVASMKIKERLRKRTKKGEDEK